MREIKAKCKALKGCFPSLKASKQAEGKVREGTVARVTTNQAKRATVSRGQVGGHRCVPRPLSFERLPQPPREHSNGKDMETEAEETERRERPRSHREANLPLRG